MVRTAVSPAALAPVLRQLIPLEDPRLSVARLELGTELVSRTLAQERMVAILLVVFGVLAVGLACLGLYGLIGYYVVQRTSEIGIRMALGASGVVSQTGVGVAGFRSGRMEDVITGQNRVGPRFIETLGLTLIHGRDFTSADRTSTSSVSIVNESFARHFYGTTDAVGRQFLLPWGDTCSIVGVVRDARDRSITQPSERWMYLPFVPADVGQSARIVVRTTVAASTLLATLPRALARFDPAVPVYDVRTMAVQLERTLGTRRLLAVLGQLFGGVALLLVAVGLYGMLSGLVTRRKREIGIRMALGAHRVGIGWLVAREAVVAIAAGLTAGTIGVLATSRLLRSQLFGIAPNDPWVIGTTALALLIAGAFAMWLPARRATRVDPMVTLRYE